MKDGTVAEGQSADAETDRWRAAQVMGPGRVEMVETPSRAPGAGEVLIRLNGSGVCASNLGPWAGPEWQEFPLPPGALGHEGWGEVAAVGPKVEGLAPGDTVAFLGTHSYATHEIVPAALTVRLPPELTDRAPLEPVACAINVIARSALSSGDTVAIVGVGFMGLMLVQLAREAGARVIAITRRPEALRMARRMGADETVAITDHQAVIEEVRRLTDDRLCDRVIECAGAQWPLDLAAELTREGGRLVIAGYHQDGPRQVNMQLWNWRGLDVVNAHERSVEVQMRGLRAAATMLAEGRLDLGPLITHRYPLAQLGEALDATRDKPEGFIKAVVQCR